MAVMSNIEHHTAELRKATERLKSSQTNLEFNLAMAEIRRREEVLLFAD